MHFAPTNQSNSNPALFCSKLSEYVVIQYDSIACNVIHKTADYTSIKCSIWGTEIACSSLYYLWLLCLYFNDLGGCY